MVAATLSLASLSLMISGLADFTDDTTAFIIWSTFARVLFGIFAFPLHVACLEIIQIVFPDRFDFMNGLMQMGYFSGQGVGQAVGAALYERFGYKVPFIYGSSGLIFATILTCLFIPPCPSLAAKSPGKKRNQSGPEGSVDEVDEGSALSYLVFLPVCACVIVNCGYAYLQIATTPYLLEEFSIPLSVGGTVLATVSAGVAIGSSLSGAIIQSKIINVYTQMASGAVLVGVGLLVMFPSPSISFVYNNIPFIAYPAGFLTGVGDPIITVATLRAMIDIQTKLMGACEGQTYLNLFSIWLISHGGAAYFGTFAGGILLQMLSYQNGTKLLVSLCGISVAICLVTKALVDKRTSLETQRLTGVQGKMYDGIDTTEHGQ